MHPYRARVEETLAEFGGLYTFDDLLDLIDRGEMQSFSTGESWAVTQICDFPRKRAVSIEFAVGDIDELKELEKQIDEFAKRHNIDLVMANGRLGFDHVKTNGWKKVSSTYVKDLSYGS